MEYHLLTYSLLFLPIVIVLYQIVPQKYRCAVLLAADYLFFWMVSKWLIVFFLIATATTYGIGLWLSHVVEHATVKGKQLTKKKRQVLAVGIAVTVSMLVAFKYLKVFGIGLKWVAPIGISYYTLQTISYMTDVYRGVVKADRNFVRVALYLSFFPQIMEGPISRYSETAHDLYEGRGIEYQNLVFGYQRILWGLFKKMMIADRLAPYVSNVFRDYSNYSGVAVLIGVICYTIQLYAEFSGCMDIIIGSGEIFGIKLPENFRQPFFADSASDFWRRWHITLGTWLKDYIFYPVSLAKPVKKIAKKVKGTFGLSVSKFVAPTIALFFVWLGNGIWHGAGWTYLFYGMYYFVLIFIENITEESRQKWAQKHNIDYHKFGWRILTFIKLFVIINLGEMFFRAPTLTDGFGMLAKICTDFQLSALGETNFIIDNYDILMVVGSICILFVVDVIKEYGIGIREKIASFKLPIRWSFWYAAIFVIIIFGAYGAGYTIMDMIYASY